MRLAVPLATLCLVLGTGLVPGCAAPSATTPSMGQDAPSGAATASATPDAASLVAERCTRCHSTVRIKDASHDKRGWEATVARMRGRGAELSEAEATRVVEFLAGGGAARL